MKVFRMILAFAIILPIFFSGCSENDPTSASKDNIFIYGLLGIGPDWSNPDSSYFWIYSRVFNHPDNQSLEAELSRGEEKIPLETGYWHANTYFTEGRLDFSFESDEQFGFRVWDSKNTYSGEITTLVPLKITRDTVISNQIILEWTDINADFYDIEFRDYDNYEEHFYTENNQFTINISALDIGESGYLDIQISGLKGFSPLSNPSGNIKGCYGYLFGYSYNSTELNLQTMTFLKSNRKNTFPNLDKLMSLLKSNNYLKIQDTPEIKFQFTYAYIYNSGYSSSGYNSFYSTTLVEPADALTHFEGYIDDVKLTSSSWVGFYNTMSDYDVYDMYNKDDRFEFKLNVNEQLDSASVSIPDTFSIITQLPSEQIPAAPFTIYWQTPDNADFFFIDVSWVVEGDSLDHNSFFITTENSYTFTSVPANAVSGWINVTAMNGVSPLHLLEPNLGQLNGYYYSNRHCRNSLYFSVNNLSPESFPNNNLLNEQTLKLNQKINHFIISKLAEKYPDLQKHKSQLLKGTVQGIE